MDIVNNMGKSLKKNRMLWIGGAVLIGAVTLFFIMRPSGGGASGGGAVQQGPSDQQVAINAELQARQMEIQASLAIAGIQAQAQINAAANEMAALELTTSAQLTAMSAQLAEQRYSTDRLTEVQLAGMASQEAMFKIQEENALVRDQLQATLTQNMATIQAEVYTSMAKAQAEQAMHALQMSADVSREQIASNAAVQLGMISSQTQLGLAREQTARLESSNALTGNIMGGLFGMIGGIFSDTRLKKNIKDEGYRERGFFGKQSTEGLPEYSYEYVGGIAAGRHYGIMAQDAFASHSGAVYSRGDYLEVDYSRLAG